MMGVFIGEYSLLDLLLFPTSIFLLLITLSDLPVNILPILALIFVALTLYSLRFRLTLSEIVRSLLFSLLHLFFREVATRGSHHIPKEGPVLLACAPHGNQFVDPICVMSITDRFVRFLCAAWSMRQPYIGDIARALKAIPVERAVDIAKKGEGKVTIKGNEVIGDELTRFTQYSPGHSFLIKDEQYSIATIENDHHMTLTHTPDQSTNSKPTSYSCAPRIDQSSVFTHVWDALGAGEVVGIFPEGLSHDQSSLLPIKAGVAVMALGACAKHEGLPLKIIPVGLNYFQGSKFRSRVYLDIAAGITPTKSQIEGYKAGGEAKQAAINELLEHVRASLKLVTATAPSHRILHLFWAVRRLYTPDNVSLSVTKKLELVRRFEKYWSALQDEPEAIALAGRVEAYNEKLLALGIRDSEVKVATSNPHYVFPMFIQRVSLLLMMGIAAFPGGLLNLPVMCASKVVSTYKAKEAAKESPEFKIKGNDVIATWKLMVAGAMLPLSWILYPIIAAIVGWRHDLGAFRCWAAMSLLQIPLMYASVRTAEVGWRMLLSLKPLWYALTGHVGMKELKEERDALAQDIKRLVDVYGPKLWPDFEKQRVISQDRTLNKHWDAQLSNDENEKRLTPKSEDDFQKTHFLRFRSRKELGL